MAESRNESSKNEDHANEDKPYERAERQARALLDLGFRLGGTVPLSRDELHERQR